MVVEQSDIIRVQKELNTDMINEINYILGKYQAKWSDFQANIDQITVLEKTLNTEPEQYFDSELNRMETELAELYHKWGCQY
jgi:plasmid maintenance system antidote protein VapI